MGTLKLRGKHGCLWASSSLTHQRVVSGRSEPHLEDDTNRTQCRDREKVEWLGRKRDLLRAKTQLLLGQEEGG